MFTVFWKNAVPMLAALGLLAGVSAARAADDEPLHRVYADACKTCHDEIYKQWRGSMHARSTALQDPIHAAFYRMTVGDPAQEDVKDKEFGKYPGCLFCHAPNAAIDQKTKLDSHPAYGEGVNCMVCHALKSYKGTRGPDGKPQLGLRAYERAEVLQGAGGFPAGGAPVSKLENPHLGADAMLPLEANAPLLRTSAACMGCHDRRDNPQGVPLCATGEEIQASKSFVSCQSCHMPVIDGLADHSIRGGHDLATLKRSGVFTLEAVPADGKLRVAATLYNGLPHSLPTGAPFRAMFVKLTAYDAQGQAVWENFKKDPGKEDPQAYLAYLLVDADGHPAGPPTATRVGQDSRLRPNETRILRYEIPSQGVALVRGEWYYSLLQAELAAKLDQLPEALRAPQLVYFAEVKLDG